MDNRAPFFNFLERPGTWQRVLPYALLAGVTFALYGASLYFGFVWDDVHYIERNYWIQGLSWNHLQAIWTQTYFTHYAPLHNTLLAVLHAVSGLSPFGYHLAQVLLHGACVCLVYFLLARIESPRVALLASLLFAVYPANIETVAWISETKSTLAFLLFLLSFWFYIRLQEGRRWSDGILCTLALCLSLLAKINTVVAPAIFLLYTYREGPAWEKKNVLRLGWFFLVSAVFTGIHLSAFHGSAGALESAYYGSLWVHLQNIPLLLLFYVRMAIVPYPLSAWQMFAVHQDFNWALAAGWLAMLGLGWLLWRSSRPAQFWGLWFVVFLAPVLQIVPFPIWVADRYLYIPVVGAFVLLARGFFQAWERWPGLWRRRGLGMAAGAVLLAFAWHTHSHLPVWRNNLTLWTATAKTCPTSAYCHCTLGLALLQAGQTEQGVRELIRAVEMRPIPRYLIFLGDAYTLNAKDYRQALIAYQLALEQGGPEITAEFYARLARLHLRRGDGESAAQAIVSGARINADHPDLLVAESFLKRRQEDLAGARTALRKALAVTGQEANPGGLVFHFWRDAAEVEQLVSDLLDGSGKRL